MRIPNLTNMSKIPSLHLLSGALNAAQIIAKHPEAIWLSALQSPMYQLSVGGDASALGDPVGRIEDLGAGSYNAIQSVSAFRPTFTDDTPDHWALDGVGDDVNIDFTSHPSVGSTLKIVEGSKEGVWSGAFTVPSGVWNLRPNPSYSPSNTPFELFMGNFSDAEIAILKQHIIDQGSAGDFGAVTSFASFFRSRTDLVAVDLSNFNFTSAGSIWFLFNAATNVIVSGYENLDMSTVTDCYFSFSSINNESFDISAWDLTSATRLQSTWYNCTDLVNFIPGDTLNSVTMTNYTTCWRNCALNEDSVNAILVGIEAAGTSSGTLAIDGGTNAAPTGVGATAVTALEGRGWTVSTN